MMENEKLIRELRLYARLYKSGECLGREIEGTDTLMEKAADRLAELDERLVCPPRKEGGASDDMEGVCPVCGWSLCYTGENEIDDSGGVFRWICPNPKCGASGLEGYDRIFDRHYEVTDKDGNPIPGRPE